MKNKFLITTPIKTTWPKTNRANLYFCSESAISNFEDVEKKFAKFEINRNVWENKIKLEKDYKYLQELYEKLLEEFTLILNNYNSVLESKNFWRIVLGPWLGKFIPIYFERWKNIDKSIKKNQVYENIYLNLKPKNFIPYDYIEFQKFSFNDYWNQYIYQKILESFSTKQSVLNIQNSTVQKSLNKKKKARKTIDYKFKLKEFAKKLISKSDTRTYNYFIYKTYLSLKDEFKLNIKLNQFPLIKIQNFAKENKKIDLNLRKKIRFKSLGKNKFELSLNNILPLQIPTIFIENFDNLVSFYENSNLPSNPKAIFTSNAAWPETHIAYYIGKLKKNKTRLFYGQHGGNYFISKILWPEIHEKKISDKFLSWGFKEKNKKVLPIGKFKNIEINKTIKKDLLIMLKHRDRYFYSLDSSSGTESFSTYVHFISSFLLKLNNNLQSNSVLRLPPWNNNIKKFDIFSKLANNFHFNSSNSIEKAFSRAKIIIHTLLSTSINDSLNLNLPTIIILKKKNNPLRFSAKKVFDYLYKANILFYDTDKAAKFINNIWSSHKINEWWKSKKTQNAVNKFNAFYARNNKNLVQDLSTILRKVK